jgi:alanine racemase
MVKANAYGLGAVRVARALEVLDPWGFGVATVQKAIELREAGIDRPLVIFTPATYAKRGLYAEYGLRAAIDDPDVAATWRLPYHVEIDTGMSRCGMRYDDDRLATFATHNLEGLFTHFFAADIRPDTVERQWNRFAAAIGRIGKDDVLLHAANSAGSWRLQQRLDLARPGIFLYGGRCGSDLPEPLPVVSVRANVVSLRVVPQGESVSYAGEWTAARDTTVATARIGYGDGFPWTARNKASVIIGGRRYPVVGRVTMDFVMVDLGPGDSPVRVGDVATIIGEDAGEQITVDQLADWSGTISYEILTRIGDRLKREYLDG